MNPPTQSKNATILPILIALTFGCFGLSPQAQAVCQEGCGAGNFNTFLGEDALINNTTGTYNTAVGFNALYSNTDGPLNTATGSYALFSNTTGNGNTATGWAALFSNTTGAWNTAIGVGALISNTTGGANTADGYQALSSNTTGNWNTANGVNALFYNTTGTSNTADGFNALINNTTGGSNIALGYLAGENLTTGNNNIDIGNLGVAGESNTIRVGTVGTQTATFIAGIRETPLAQGVAMAIGITADGQLGVKASSARFKEAIRPMNKASETILSLRPVTFRYKKNLDPKGTPQFGLVAEEVAKVDPDLVARDEKGKPFTVRYEEINAMLLNEFLKEHRKVEEQSCQIANQDCKVEKLEATVAQQQKDFQSAIAEQRRANEALTATVKAQAAQIQKVSDQLTTQAPVLRVVANN